VIAVLGLAGPLSFTITQRAREIGIRIALGSRRRDIARTLLVEYLLPVAAGGALAFPVAAMYAAMLSEPPWEVTPFDIRVYAESLGVFVAATAVAALLSARRAWRLDPIAAIRG
jgi:ABC-type antimicrobial peptide transport system permease subunit